MRDAAQASVLVALLFMASCKSGKPLPLLGKEIPARSPEKILEQMMVHRTDTIRYYSAKTNVSLDLPDGNKNFKAQIRSVMDSATWVSVVPALGIEVARIVLTPDSLKLMDRVSDRYFIGDTAAAKAKFGLQPSLELLQQALLGNAIGLDPSEKYRSDRENGQYVLTSREKRRFIRAAEDISPADTLGGKDMNERRLERTLRRAEEKEAIVLRYWVDADEFLVTRVQITDLALDQSADIHYDMRNASDEGRLPTRIRITLTEPGRIATGTLEISRIDLNGPVNMAFRVPEKFTPMP